MRIILLGSCGLIGSAILKHFRSKNIEIIEYDIKRSNDEDLTQYDSIDKLSNIIQKDDIVFFAAFDVGGSKYISNIHNISYINNNLMIMKNVFTAVEKTGSKIIFFSSQMSQMIDNIYGLCKYVGEKYTQLLGGLIIRIWNVYGYEKSINEKSHVISDMIRNAFEIGIIKLLTNGNECRQFLHCDEFAKIMEIIVYKYDEILSDNTIIDISSFKWISIFDVASMIKNIIHNKYNKIINIHLGDQIDKTHTIIIEPKEYIKKYVNISDNIELYLTSIIEQVYREFIDY